MVCSKTALPVAALSLPLPAISGGGGWGGGGEEEEGHSRDATCVSKTLTWHSAVQGQAKMSWGGGRGSGEGGGRQHCTDFVRVETKKTNKIVMMKC